MPQNTGIYLEVCIYVSLQHKQPVKSQYTLTPVCIVEVNDQKMKMGEKSHWFDCPTGVDMFPL